MRATREKRSIGTWIATLAATMALLPMLLAGESIPPVGKFAESNSFHLLLEKDRGHFYPVLPSTTEVDANADLIVNFRGPENPAVGSPGPDWQQTSNLLKFVKENVQERVRFAAELRTIDLSNEQQATNFSHRLRQFNNESIQKINGALTNAGVDEGMRLSIYTGAFDGRKNALRPYENLGRWLSNRLDTLTKELKQFASNRTAEVSVQAFHLPKRGSEKALHVDNYDRIPAGELRPIDRLGLRMNDAEQAEFQAKLKAAQEGKAAASEIMTNSAQLKAIFKAKMEAVRVRLEELEKLLENQAAVDWTTNFAASPIGLALKAQAETNPSPEVKKAANDLLADIQKFHDGFKEASALYLKIRGLTGPLRRGEQADLAEMVSSMQMIAGGLQTFVSQVNTLVTQVSQWPALLERSTKNLEVVGSHLAADVRDKIIPQELSSLVTEFSEKFP
ncbi:MAG TPA: hypothetical protein VI282_07420, partial [Verrucomicrobiae bacterium]